MGRFEVRTAQSRGFDISFEDAGTGNAIVLVNGFGGSAAEWRDVGCVDLLCDSYRVLSVDSLGHGASSAPHDWRSYRAPDVGADLIAVMDAANVHRAVLWGYSRGAWLVAVAAAEYPQRVAGVVLGGSHAVLDAPDPTVEPWVQAMLDADWARVWAGSDVSDYDRQQTELNDPRALGAVVLGRGQGDYRVDVTRCTAPAMVYCGGGDDPDNCEPVAVAFGVSLKVVGTRDHFGAFHDVDLTVPLVQEHLRRWGW
jgi:pimeloyl-ACP methyl ester carboxylesterase